MKVESEIWKEEREYSTLPVVYMVRDRSDEMFEVLYISGIDSMIEI